MMNNEYKESLGNFASTGGWTLGSVEATALFGSAELLSLDSYQQDKVAHITANIHRPCCGNSASFPDCNHGMAILGLVELMVDQGSSDVEIYEAALAYYFSSVRGVDWDKITPQEVLAAGHSSALGYQNIKNQIGEVPDARSAGTSCSA